MPRNHHVMSRCRAPRKPTLRHDHTVGADHAVVGDHHQIIDFRPFPNMGPRKAPPINRGVRPNLRLIVDLDNTQLGNLHMFPLFHLIAKSIRPHHRPRMQYHSISHTTSFPHIHPRMKNTPRPDFHVPPNIRPCPNLRSIPDLRPFLHHDVRPQTHPVSQFCLRRDDGRGVRPNDGR